MFWKNIFFGVLLGLISGGVYLLLSQIVRMPPSLSAVCAVVIYAVMQKVIRPQGEKLYLGAADDEQGAIYTDNSLQIVATFEEKLSKLGYLSKSVTDAQIHKEIENIRGLSQKILKLTGSKIDKSTNVRQQMSYYLESAENLVEKHLSLLHNADLMCDNAQLLQKTSPALALIRKSLHEVLEKTNADLQIDYQIELEVLENQVSGNKK